MLHTVQYSACLENNNCINSFLTTIATIMQLPAKDTAASKFLFANRPPKRILRSLPLVKTYYLVELLFRK